MLRRISVVAGSTLSWVTFSRVRKGNNYDTFISFKQKNKDDRKQPERDG